MQKSKNKALFLDRDGVIIKDVGYLQNPDQIELIEGFVELGLAAQDFGYKLIVITNQSGVARGYFNLETVARCNLRLYEQLKTAGVEILSFYVCPHHPKFTGNCFCRKPASLLFEKAVAKFQIDSKNAWMVGDKESDILAGKNIGCHTARIIQNKKEISDADVRIFGPNELITYL